MSASSPAPLRAGSSDAGASSPKRGLPAQEAGRVQEKKVAYAHRQKGKRSSISVPGIINTNQAKRDNRKKQKLQEQLREYGPSTRHAMSDEDIQKAQPLYYAGKKGYTWPPELPLNTTCKVADVDLHVLTHPTRGVYLKASDGNFVAMQVPRQRTLAVLGRSHTAVAAALRAMEEQRQPSGPEQGELIIKGFLAKVENLAVEFMGGAVLRGLQAAKEFGQWPSLSQDNISIWAGPSTACSQYLQVHTDSDYFLSMALVVPASGELQPEDEDKVTHFFCFPKQGRSIAMKPFDLILFDATEPHCISSGKTDGDFFCISFSLKTLLVGNNSHS